MLFHCAFLLWILSIYNNSLHTVSLSLNKHIEYDAPIFFVSPSIVPIVIQPQSSSSRNETIISNQKQEIPPITEKQSSKKNKETIIKPLKKEPEQKKNYSYSNTYTNNKKRTTRTEKTNNLNRTKTNKKNYS